MAYKNNSVFCGVSFNSLAVIFLVGSILRQIPSDEWGIRIIARRLLTNYHIPF